MGESLSITFICLLEITTFVHVYDIADIFVASLTSAEAEGKHMIGLGERNSYAVVAVESQSFARPIPIDRFHPLTPMSQSLLSQVQK